MDGIKKYTHHVLTRVLETRGYEEYKQAWDCVANARKELQNAEANLKLVARQMKEFKEIPPLVSGGKVDIVDIGRFDVTVEFQVTDVNIQPRHRAAPKPNKPTHFQVPHHVEDKTVRMLLNGNMLTDGEKKKLVSGIVPGLFDDESAERQDATLEGGS